MVIKELFTDQNLHDLNQLYLHCLRDEMTATVARLVSL